MSKAYIIIIVMLTLIFLVEIRIVTCSSVIVANIMAVRRHRNYKLSHRCNTPVLWTPPFLRRATVVLRLDPGIDVFVFFTNQVVIRRHTNCNCNFDFSRACEPFPNLTRIIVVNFAYSVWI